MIIVILPTTESIQKKKIIPLELELESPSRALLFGGVRYSVSLGR